MFKSYVIQDICLNQASNLVIYVKTFAIQVTVEMLIVKLTVWKRISCEHMRMAVKPKQI